MPSTERADAGGRPAATGAVSSSSRPSLAGHVRLRFDRTRQTHVLLQPESVIVLNATGADIVGLCDGQRTVAEIARELHGRYDRVVDDEVCRFLSRLLAKRCVEVRDG